MTIASMPESMRNAFYRDLLERVATAPQSMPPVRSRVRAMVDGLRTEPDSIEVRCTTLQRYAGRICLSCGARESGGVLPCGH